MMRQTIEKNKASELEDLLFEHYCRKIFRSDYIPFGKRITAKETIGTANKGIAKPLKNAD